MPVFTSKLSGSNDANFVGDIFTEGNLNVSGALVLSGAVALHSDVQVTGNLDVSGTIKSYKFETAVYEDRTYLGSSIFGNDDSDTHTFHGDVSSSARGIFTTGLTTAGPLAVSGTITMAQDKSLMFDAGSDVIKISNNGGGALGFAGPLFTFNSRISGSAGANFVGDIVTEGKLHITGTSHFANSVEFHEAVSGSGDATFVGNIFAEGGIRVSGSSTFAAGIKGDVSGSGRGIFVEGLTTAGELHVSDSVGIGTNDPGRSLEIAGADNGYARFDATNYTSYTVGSDSYGFIIFDDDEGGTPGYKLVISDTTTRKGYLGVGGGVISPLARLHVSGTNELAAGPGLVRVDGDSQTGIFFVTGSGPVRASGGRVGINTLTPSKEFTVIGQISASSAITSVGNIVTEGDLLASSSIKLGSGAPIVISTPFAAMGMTSYLYVSGAQGINLGVDNNHNVYLGQRNLSNGADLNHTTGLRFGLNTESNEHVNFTAFSGTIGADAGFGGINERRSIPTLRISGSKGKYGGTVDFLMASGSLLRLGGGDSMIYHTPTGLKISSDQHLILAGNGGKIYANHHVSGAQTGFFLENIVTEHGVQASGSSKLGAVAYGFRSTTGNTDIGETDYYILFAGTSNATGTLPALAQTQAGLTYVIRNSSGNDSDFVVKGNGSETIDGVNDQTLASAGTAITVVSNGSDKWIIFNDLREH